MGRPSPAPRIARQWTPPTRDAPPRARARRSAEERSGPSALAVLQEHVQLGAEQQGHAPDPEPEEQDGDGRQTSVEESEARDLGRVVAEEERGAAAEARGQDRKSTRLNSS